MNRKQSRDTARSNDNQGQTIRTAQINAQQQARMMEIQAKAQAEARAEVWLMNSTTAIYSQMLRDQFQMFAPVVAEQKKQAGETDLTGLSLDVLNEIDCQELARFSFSAAKQLAAELGMITLKSPASPAPSDEQPDEERPDETAPQSEILIP